MVGDFLRIKTPSTSQFKNGSTTARLMWSPSFGQQRTNQFLGAQMAVDSEVLRYSSAYIPRDTGMLDTSGRLGTVLGSGNVRYIAPYSSFQYYNTALTRHYDNRRGAKWFERMKLLHKAAIERVAKTKVGAT